MTKWTTAMGLKVLVLITTATSTLADCSICNGTGNAVIEMLRQLPALPVPHYAWPFCHLEDTCTMSYMDTHLPWSDASVMKEYARITHSVSAYAGLGFYSNLTQLDIDTMWEKLVAGVNGTDATIAIQLEVGMKGSAVGDHTRQVEEGVKSPIRPTNTMIQQLKNATAALARANLKLGTHVTIGTVMVDQEGWGTPNPSIITRNNDIVYNASASVFGKDVNIQYYGRGMATVHDRFPSGFWEPEWYTFDEIDNRQLSVSLYTVPEKGTTRLDYQKTVARMKNVSALCTADNVRRKAEGLPPRWCPEEVVPWIALGSGYRHPDPGADPNKGGTFAIPWDYQIWYSWQIGRDVCNATNRPAVAKDFEWAKKVALYPSAFDQRSPPLPGGDGLTTMLLHFVAYVRGASGIAELPTVPTKMRGGTREGL